MVQHGPCRGDGAARLGAEHARRSVHAAQPVVGDETLERAQSSVAVHHHRCAFGCVAELVQIDAHRSDSVDCEVPLRQFDAESGEVGKRDTAHARVDVAVRPVRRGNIGDFGDRVDHALRILRGRGNEHDRVVVGRSAHRVGVGAPVATNCDPPHFDVKVGASLLESSVGRRRQHHVGPGDCAWPPGCVGGSALSFVVTKLVAGRLTELVAGSLHRHEDALGAAAGEEAAGTCWSMQPASDDCQHVGLHGAQRRECVDVEGVLAGEPSVGLGGELVGLWAGVVGEREHPAVLPAHVAVAQRLEAAQGLLRAPAVLRQA